MSTLMNASKQWSMRPADEKFASLEGMDRAAQGFRAAAAEAPGVPYSTLRVQAQDGEVMLVGRQNVPSKLTHWAFGQLSTRVGAPAGYLRDLPATLAAQNLNHGLSEKAPEEQANVLLHRNGGYMVRAFTSPQYTRIWNSDITQKLLGLTQVSPEWQPAPAAFDGSRGLYLSDHDMFAFLVDNDRRIFEKAPGGGLGRGFFVWNSEVGASSFGVMTFYYQYVCGNHMVWGAKGVHELRVRHVGNADERAFGKLAVELRKYADASGREDELRLENAQRMILGQGKDEVLDAVFKLAIPGLSRKVITSGYETAEKHRDWYGEPGSVFGMVSGITQNARDLVFADQRVELDRAAGKLLQVAF